NYLDALIKSRFLGRHIHPSRPACSSGRALFDSPPLNRATTTLGHACFQRPFSFISRRSGPVPLRQLPRARRRPPQPLPPRLRTTPSTPGKPRETRHSRRDRKSTRLNSSHVKI